MPRGWERLARMMGIAVAAAFAGGLAYWYYANRLVEIPNRPLRIGFEPNPPFQIRTANGFGGLAVEVVDEAARRAGVKLQWLETGTSSEEALRKGMVDLWPLMSDLPERRKWVHFSRPWVMTSHVLIVRSGSAVPDREFTGRVAVFHLPLQIRLLKGEFPRSQAVPLADAHDVLRAVCTRAATAGLLAKRVAIHALDAMPPECSPVSIRAIPLPNLTLENGVASTFEAAPAADAIRRQIGSLYRDGTLALTLARYSFYGLDDAWDTYDLLESAVRGRWIAWGAGALAVALTLALWQQFSLRQRRRAEKVLRTSEERFRAIFQQAGVGVAQISLDGKVEMANDRYCSVVGYARENLLGKETVDISHREDLREQIAMLPRLLAGEIDSYSMEKRYNRQDGTVTWANVCKTVERDTEGRPKCFIAVVEDITKRKQAEAALRESEERFRNLADSAPVLIWLTGPDKVHTFFNRAWLEFTGRTIEQELRDGWIASVHPEERERCSTAYAAAFDSRRDFQVECRLRRADGEYRWVLSRGVARSLNDGTFAGYIGCILDITDLKRSYEQYLAFQKLESVGVMAAGVAHDFNNLLGAITSLADSAQYDLPPDSPATADIDLIRQKALQAAQIASQLMTFTRQDSAPATTLDLSSLIAGMLELLKVSIAKSAVLKISLAEGLPPILANPSELRQVVMNLVINASEALEGKTGSITVATARSEGESSRCRGVRLEVADTGSGMTAETKARLFDPFFTTRFAGRGLGLFAVQGIVRRLGGCIEVESAPNAGSRFMVLLPVNPCPESRPAVPRSDAAALRRRRTILFIEDEDTLRLSIAKLLRKRDFDVIEAPDGPAALEIFRNADPGAIDIVLLDVTMPGMDGREVFDELRRIRPDAHVILCTAYSRETVIAEFGDRLIDGFVRKPYRADDLARILG